MTVRPSNRGVRLSLGRSLALGYLILLAVAAGGAELLPLAPAGEMNLAERARGASAGHPLGTDAYGRDLLSRIVFGARASLTVAVGATLIGLLVGGMLGMLAGYYRGIAERIVLIVTDTLLAFPGLVLAMLFAVYAGRSLATITLTLGLLTIPAFARVSRSHTLQVGAQEFIEAARALGLARHRIVLRHVLPNVLPPTLAFSLLVAAIVIVLEGALSFLGLGLPDPAPSWGGMIAEGRQYLDRAPHLSLLPALALFATIMAINVLAPGNAGQPR